MPSKPPDQDAGLIVGETGTQRLVGYVTEIGHDDGRPRTWLDVGPQHTNRHGVLHGGIQSMLLDSVCGVAGSLTVDPSGTTPFLTVSMTTQFLASAHPGRVTATATITGGGRKLLFISGALHDESGRLLATSTGVYKRVPQEKLT